MPPQIVSGPLIRPATVLLYGVEGIGKTTLVTAIAQALGRKLLFLDTEFGTRMPADRVHVHSMKEWDAIMEHLIKEQHDYNLVAIDTITSAEPLVETDRVLAPQKFTSKGKKITRMNEFEYGAGSVALREEFDRIIYFQLDELVKRGISVITVGHAQIVRFNLPELVEGFDRYEVAMDRRVSATLRQWHDHVLFANWDYRVTTNEADQTRGLAGKERVLHCQHAAAFDAKNRAGLPEKVAWDAKLLVPLFSNVQPASTAPAASTAVDHAQRWSEIVQKINGNQRWSSDALYSFLRSRFPNFDGSNYQIIPADYLNRALTHSQAFATTIDEFITTNTKTAETQPAEPAQR